MTQQGDILLFQTTDGGNINVENGVVEMSPGLETMAYLCMFGGNEDDDGRPTNKFNWWGNVTENESSRKYRSETQYLLKSLPATTGNLRRIQDAVNRDLSVFIDEKIATSISVTVTIPALNTVSILIKIEANGEEVDINFVENWKSST